MPDVGCSWKVQTSGAADDLRPRPSQFGRKPRPLQENGTRCSRAQPS